MGDGPDSVLTPRGSVEKSELEGSLNSEYKEEIWPVRQKKIQRFALLYSWNDDQDNVKLRCEMTKVERVLHVER